MEETHGFSDTKRRPSLSVLAAIVALHALLFYGLIRALAPDLVTDAAEVGFSAFDLTTPQPSPSPTPTQEPAPAQAAGPPEKATGAEGNPGQRAEARAVSAPEAPIVLSQSAPAPRVSSTGDANRSGAVESGDGTGASGDGLGTGAGGEGSGQGGGGIATEPTLTRTIRDVSAFPIPPGGRAARVGTRTVVILDVSAGGRVTGCRVTRSSGFPDTDRKVCELAYDQVRFEPARDASGNPVPASFAYQQRFYE